MGHEARLRAAQQADVTARSDWSPFYVGYSLGRFEGQRLFGYFGGCPNHVDPETHRPDTVHFTTRALESEAGVRLEAEVCDTCGRISKLQRS